MELIFAIIIHFEKAGLRQTLQARFEIGLFHFVQKA